MQIILDEWQRLEKIVRWTGLSVNSFALNIGLPRAENLYQIKKGNNGISKELAELISGKYPEISRAWIITGEGDMFLGDSGDRISIPCYESDAVYLAGLEILPQPSYMVSMPKLRGASFGALWQSGSMEPDIPRGATVILAPVSTEQIIPGFPYLIVTEHFTGIRTVHREPGSTTLRLKARNPEFGEMEADICEVRKIFLVKGHIYFNQ